MTDYARALHRGTGPGAITPDGCSVEMYSRFTDNGETGIIAAAVPAGTTLLELGCGAGRMTRPLVARGFRVTAVDESPEMLERVGAAAPTVLSAIEDLDLGRRFDVVTLTSFLVNTAQEGLAGRLLATCARHVAAGGHVILQREADDRAERLRPGYTGHRSEGRTITVVSVDRVADGVDRTCIAYDFEGDRWTQTFYSRHLTVPAFETELAAAGLAVDAYLTPDRSWVRAVPASPAP